MVQQFTSTGMLLEEVRRSGGLTSIQRAGVNEQHIRVPDCVIAVNSSRITGSRG